MSALLQLHLHSRLNTWLQWIGQRQLQDETRNIQSLWFGASYIRDLMVFTKWNWPRVHLCLRTHLRVSMIIVIATHGNAFLVTGPFWAKSDGGFASQRARNAELLYFLWQLEHIIGFSMIWDAIRFTWRHCNTCNQPPAGHPASVNQMTSDKNDWFQTIYSEHQIQK